jgi:hypothetical protein
MALNPPMTAAGDPCRVDGEHFILQRNGCEFEVKVNGGSKYAGKGIVRISS